MAITFPKIHKKTNCISKKALYRLCSTALISSGCVTRCADCAFYSKDNFLEAIKEKGV